MEAQALEEFRELLKERGEAILKEANHTKEGMFEDGALFPDPVDRALLESNRSFTLRLRDRERKLLKKIQQAVERFDNGTFGICEECGEEIEHQRLRARPVTTLCIECKEEQERLEKMEL